MLILAVSLLALIIIFALQLMSKENRTKKFNLALILIVLSTVIFIPFRITEFHNLLEFYQYGNLRMKAFTKGGLELRFFQNSKFVEYYWYLGNEKSSGEYEFDHKNNLTLKYDKASQFFKFKNRIDGVILGEKIILKEKFGKEIIELQTKHFTTLYK